MNSRCGITGYGAGIKRISPDTQRSVAHPRTDNTKSNQRTIERSHYYYILRNT